MTGDNRPKPILYTCQRSRGLRATWAAEELGVDLDIRMLPFPPRHLAPEYLEINPLGTIPMLIDGDTEMTESCAITHYLATKDGPSEFAVAPGERDYGEYLDYTYHADATLTFPQTVFMRFAVFEKHKGWEEAGQAYAKWYWKRLVKIERRLENREFLCADRFTMADVCVGYALILSEVMNIEDEVPQVVKDYRARLTSRPAYKRALAKEADLAKGITSPPG